MTELSFYLIKMTACSGIFFLYYLAALRNRQFHQWNRFYLLAGAAFSMVIPFLQFPLVQWTGAAPGEALRLLRVVGSANDYLEEVTVYSHRSLSAAQWALILYAGVSMVLLLFLLVSVTRIVGLIRSHAVRLVSNIRFVNTRAPGTPFSFLHYIFWNEDIDLQSETGQQIFQHELVHVREKHTLDKLFLQLILVLFWCNPFFWLMRRELRQIHEFIADRKSVAQHGTAAFAAMVLQSAYPKQYNHLTNSFFQTSIKRRLNMLSKMQHPRISYFGRILALPVIALTVLAFAARNKGIVLPSLSLTRPITVVIDAGHGMIGTNQHTGSRSGDLYEDEIVLALAKDIQALNNNARVRIVLTRTGMQSVDLKKRVAIAEEQGADLFISLHTNVLPQSDPSFSSHAGRSSGLEVSVSGSATPYQAQSELLGSALQEELQTVHKTYPGLLRHASHVWVLDHNSCPSVLVECGYLSDADDRAFLVREDNRKLLAQKILIAIQRYVLSRENSGAAVDTVPQKKEIADVQVDNQQKQVVVTYKNGEQQTSTVSYHADTASPAYGKDKPLYVVNGEIYSGDIKTINPADIQQIYVLKDEHATKKYGDKGLHGVVEIILKPHSERAQRDTVTETLAKADVEPFIDREKWKVFLEENTRLVIEQAGKTAPAGKYTVNIRFRIDREGSVSDITALNDPGYGMGAGLVEMMKRSPKWNPALQNGRPVDAYHVQPITLVIRK